MAVGRRPATWLDSFAVDRSDRADPSRVDHPGRRDLIKEAEDAHNPKEGLLVR